jgi:hypothetical protein
LEKLLGAGSLGGFICHIVRRHATLLASLGGLSLLFVVQTITSNY